MADNPKLTIELVDKGGTATPSNPGGTSSSQGGGNYYDPTADIQKRITVEGIQVAPIPPAQVVEINQPPYRGSTGFYEANTPDISASIKTVLEQNKDMTASELATLFQINKKTAEEYIAKFTQQPQQPSQAAPQQPPSTPDPTPKPSSTDAFFDRVKDSILSDEEKYDKYVTRLQEGLAANKLTQDEYNKAVSQARPINELELLSERIRQSQMSPEERFNQTRNRVTEAVNQGLLDQEAANSFLERQAQQLEPVSEGISLNQATGAISNLSIASGFSRTTGGAVLQSALNTAPAVEGLLGSIGSGAGLATIGLSAAGVITALIGAGTTGTYAGIRGVFNEANRAVNVAAPLSPEVAGAQAISELRQFQADLRSSQALGPFAAGFIDRTSAISASLQGVRDNLTAPFLPMLNKTLDDITAVVAGLDKFISSPETQTALQIFADTFSESGISQLFNLLPDDIKQYFKKAKEEADKNLHSPYQWFDNEYPHLPLPRPFSDSGTKPIDKVDIIGAVPGFRM